MDPNTPNKVGQGAAPQEEQTPAQTPSIYKDLQAKKGFKSEEDLAKSYIEAEQELGRKANLTNKVKQQLETAGYTISEDGSISPTGQPHYQAPAQQPTYQQPTVSQEPIYDPYTGQQITDPISLQLARMPVGHREAFIVNAMLEQREKQQISSFQAESDVLSKPEAKGFESDVKQIMQALPLSRRANKQDWEDALLRVKGMRYDQAIKNAGQQGIEQFIQKENIQLPAGSGGDNSGVTLTQEQEGIYKYYQQNMPGTFKDRAHFLKATLPNAGR